MTYIDLRSYWNSVNTVTQLHRRQPHKLVQVCPYLLLSTVEELYPDFRWTSSGLQSPDTHAQELARMKVPSIYTVKLSFSSHLGKTSPQQPLKIEKILLKTAPTPTLLPGGDHIYLWLHLVKFPERCAKSDARQTPAVLQPSCTGTLCVARVELRDLAVSPGDQLDVPFIKPLCWQT